MSQCSDDLSVCVCGECPNTRAMLCNDCGITLADDWPYDECMACKSRHDAEEAAWVEEADRQAEAWWERNFGKLRRDARGRFTGGRHWPI